MSGASDLRGSGPVLTAHRAGLLGCHSCGRVWPAEQKTCARCGEHLSPPDRRKLQYVWAWLCAGIITYIPANIFPMMSTQTFAGLQGSAGGAEADVGGFLRHSRLKAEQQHHQQAAHHAQGSGIYAYHVSSQKDGQTQRRHP